MKRFSLFAILFCVTILTTLGQNAPSTKYKEITLDSSYNHTKYGIEPIDLEYRFAAYTTSFDSPDDNNGDGIEDVWGIPEWVAFEIKSNSNTTTKYNRPKWMTDDTLNEQGIAPDDDSYGLKKTGEMKEVGSNNRYSRGHMCPKATADRISEEAGYNTHTVLNAVPQLQWQNNGIWKSLEKDCNDWADTYGSVWVVCGPVFFDKNPSVWLGQADEIKAAVPDALYKIVIRETDNGIETLAFLIPNIIPKDQKDYSKYLTSIGRVQNLTGLSFLTNVPETRRVVELDKNLGLNYSEKKEVVGRW